MLITYFRHHLYTHHFIPMLEKLCDLTSSFADPSGRANKYRLFKYLKKLSSEPPTRKKDASSQSEEPLFQSSPPSLALSHVSQSEYDVAHWLHQCPHQVLEVYYEYFRSTNPPGCTYTCAQILISRCKFSFYSPPALLPLRTAQFSRVTRNFLFSRETRDHAAVLDNTRGFDGLYDFFGSYDRRRPYGHHMDHPFSTVQTSNPRGSTESLAAHIRRNVS